MPFDDREETPPVSRKIGVKKKSSTAQQNIDRKAEFDKQADAHFSQLEEYKKQIWDLSVKYKSFIESQVLPENKGPISTGVEKEVLDKLINLASQMNEDANQPEGIGSIALCMLLLKCMLIQRDAINALSFEVTQLKKHNST